MSVGMESFTASKLQQNTRNSKNLDKIKFQIILVLISGPFKDDFQTFSSTSPGAGMYIVIRGKFLFYAATPQDSNLI